MTQVVMHKGEGFIKEAEEQPNAVVFPMAVYKSYNLEYESHYTRI